jgi:outer membrane protein TolC
VKPESCAPRWPAPRAGGGSRAAAALLAVLALPTACVHYTPRPRPPEGAARVFAARRLDAPGLRAALDAQLPGRRGDWPRQEWDRADLLVAMLYFNDTLAEARAAADVAGAGRATARERPNPVMELELEYANQHDGSPLWLWAILPVLPLDVGARRSARIALADLAAQRALYELAEAIWKARSTMRRALADLLITGQQVTLLEAVHTEREAQLTMARRRLEAGEASRGDLDRLVADALQDEQQLHDARRRASLARSALAQAIGVPVAALEGLRFSWAGLEEPPEVDAQRLAGWRADALLARADVHSAVVGYSQAEQSLRLEVAKQYPDWQIGPSYTWDHGVHRPEMFLYFPLPIMNQNRGAIGEAEARREQAGAALEATVAGAYQEIDESIRQWHLAEARLGEARGPVLEAAQSIYAQTARGFAAGANDRSEMAAASVARTLAQLQVLEAARTAQDSLATLEDALRRPLEGPELGLAAVLGAKPPVHAAEVKR